MQRPRVVGIPLNGRPTGRQVVELIIVQRRKIEYESR